MSAPGRSGMLGMHGACRQLQYRRQGRHVCTRHPHLAHTHGSHTAFQAQLQWRGLIVRGGKGESGVD